MQSAYKPHVSDAIRQLRSWVTIAATVLVLCCAAQMLVYAFCAYTDARWEEVRQPKSDGAPLRVVAAPASAAPTPAPAPAAPPVVDLSPVKPSESEVAPSQVSGGVRTNMMEHAPGPIEINRVHSASELWMHRASDAATSAGVIASICLAILTMLGVVVAGGGCVPGVERATTAAVWSLVLGLLCLPWNHLMPGLGVPGIFASYGDMTHAIDSKTVAGTSAGSMALTAQWFVAPLVAMFAALGVCLWFRAGVERGVIIMSPSELDRAVEREVGMIQKRGVASSAPKAVGAMNQAMGGGNDGARGAPPGTLSAVERALDDAAAMASGERAVEAPRRRPPRGAVADEDFRRPI